MSTYTHPCGLEGCSTFSRKGDHASTWLVFDGLDTFATVSFCGQPVAYTDNQFRQYSFDVSNVLNGCKDDPVLSINFGSAPRIVDAMAEDPSLESLYPHHLLARKSNWSLSCRRMAGWCTVNLRVSKSLVDAQRTV